MAELLTRFREWLGLTPDPERKAAADRLREQDGKLRLARLDAGLPVDRRRGYALGPNRGRRGTDRC